MRDEIDWMSACDEAHPVMLARAGLVSNVMTGNGGHDMPELLPIAAKWTPHVIAVFNSIVFLDSLRFKFTNHPNTQEIFNRLDAWAGSLGAPGLFGPTGLFSQYVIGGAELLAASLLLIGMIYVPLRFLQPLGALIGLAVMTGAISFHLFTPLGIDPNNDGGGLFRAACAVWAGNLILLVLRRDELGQLLGRLQAFFTPAAA